VIKPWARTATRYLGDFRIFRLRSDEVVSPRTGGTQEVYVIEVVDWVNVLALTSDRQLVMVEQYRHGSDTVELEIPGGMMDPGDASPVASATRELREETGYEGERARVLGRIYPNPAIQNNRCHTILIEDCRLQHAPELDHGEDLVTRLVPADEVPALVAAGKIRHSLVVVALYYFDLWRRGVLANP
jgi:8-oxo-dGTP pyrophosphatase MutT (NUDIX family)